MDFQFVISDNFTAFGIDEPKGWDGINFHLQRDPRWRGFFDFVDDSLSSLQFIGDGRDYLRTQYETYGAHAQSYLTVYIQCQPNDPFVQIYAGQFDFTTYKFHEGDECYIEIGIKTNTALTKFTSRYDQQVDLDQLYTFDSVPTLQVVTSGAQFIAPNIIYFKQIINGLPVGKQITIGGTVSNNTTYTVVTSVPSFSNNIINNNGVVPTVGNTFTGDITFNAALQTLYVTGVIEGLNPGNTFTITGSASNEFTFTVVSSIAYFNYTVIKVTGVPNAVVDETVACDLAGTFSLNPIGVYTIITVAEDIVVETAATATLTGTFIKNNLDAYKFLNKQIELPGKKIIAFSKWQNVFDTIYDSQIFQGLPGPPYFGTSFITPNWQIDIQDIDETDMGTGVAVNYTTGDGPTFPFSAENPPDSLLSIQPTGGKIVCFGKMTITYNISGQAVDHSGNPFHIWTTPDLFFIIQVGTVFNPTIGQNNGPNQWAIQVINPTIPFNISGTIEVPYISGGYYLWQWFQMTAENAVAPNAYPDFKFNAGSFIKCEFYSLCDPTPCCMYLVNEAMSRCTENITDDDLRVYSDYFGRPDAQPYPSDGEGCGSMEAITSGLKIRGSVMPNNAIVPKYSVSMQDIWEALDAIHNIGMGLEGDPNRIGFKMMRVEPVQYFFNNTVLLTCDNVFEFTREIDTKLIASTFKVGYQKHETWNNNGLYDLYAMRNYRTSIKSLTNQIDKTCKFLASDYAIEFTRRQFGLTTSDSRYDDDKFVLCLDHIAIVEMQVFSAGVGLGGSIFILGNIQSVIDIQAGDSLTFSNCNVGGNNQTLTVSAVQYQSPPIFPSYEIFITIAPGVTIVDDANGPPNPYLQTHIVNNTRPFYATELGMKKDSGVHILDPDTVMNYRISPAHNAMRHFKTLVMAYRDYINGELFFTGGEGNIYGLGIIDDSCTPEGSLLSEGSDIYRSLFQNASDANPLFLPELVKFEYPMGYNQFLTIVANPYGLIGWNRNGATEYGWIEDLQYLPIDEMAKFTLRPQIIIS